LRIANEAVDTASKYPVDLTDDFDGESTAE